jgi:hypothetical protein
MTSKERVLAALHRKVPDRVPYCELGIDRALAQRLMGWGEPRSQASNLEANAYSVEEAKALAGLLHLDNISAAWFVTRIGIFPTMLSLGTEDFCLALYDDRPFVEKVLDRYCDWMEVVAERACRLDFDAFVSTGGVTPPPCARAGSPGRQG